MAFGEAEVPMLFGVQSMDSMVIAVIGAGIAGAACARALTTAGARVRVYDKSRDAGGRLATRRAERVDDVGALRQVRFDHGAPWVSTPRSVRFRRFVDRALWTGDLVAWKPTLAEGSLPLDDATPRYVAVPDMPQLCRRLLDGVAVEWNRQVLGLHRGADGWRLEFGGEPDPERFDAVVLALPPAQAAPLIAAHRDAWARHALLTPMQPCWTLMGVADPVGAELAWDVDCPPTGPLSLLMRNESRPMRARRQGEVHWVAHARPAWSREHLESPVGEVLAALQEAVSKRLGAPIRWRHAVAHRWRYATPVMAGAVLQPFRWDAAIGLGLCGDHLGSIGIEGAWISGMALADAMGAAAAPAARLAADFHAPQPAG